MNLTALIPWYYRWGAIALLVAAFAGYFWMRGDEHGTEKLLEYQAAEAKNAVRIAKGREVVTERVVTQFVKVQGATKVVYDTVEKEVVKYVEKNPGYCLDSEWRRLHDAAAANVVPGPPPESEGPSGAPRAATALDTVTANYARCARNADRLDAVEEWAEGQAKVK